MPLIRNGEDLVLKCINHELASHDDPKVNERGSTMHAAPTSYMLRGYVNDKGGRGVETNQVAPILAYVCGCCGYVELYAAKIVDPKAWG